MSTEVAELVEQIDDALLAAARPERAEGEARYLKSSLVHWGVGVPGTRSVVKAVLRAAPGLDRPGLVELVERLWDGWPLVYERRLAAVEAMAFRHQLLGLDDAPLLERLTREALTWALVDPLAVGVIGPLVEAESELGVKPAWGTALDGWADHDDFWVRRVALLALLVPLRRGEGDWERFTRYADAMLEEREFFIRKAIGWVLRDTAKRRPNLVAEWLGPRAHRASGVTVREAVKPLTDAQRSEILAAYRTQR